MARAGVEFRRAIGTPLTAPYSVHHDELPGAWHLADRHLDKGRAVTVGEGAAQRLAQVVGTCHPGGFGAKTFAEGDKIGIGEVAADQPVAVALLLDAADIAEG